METSEGARASAACQNCVAAFCQLRRCPAGTVKFQKISTTDRTHARSLTHSLTHPLTHSLTPTNPHLPRGRLRGPNGEVSTAGSLEVSGTCKGHSQVQRRARAGGRRPFLGCVPVLSGSRRSVACVYCLTSLYISSCLGFFFRSTIAVPLAVGPDAGALLGRRGRQPTQTTSASSEPRRREASQPGRETDA